VELRGWDVLTLVRRCKEGSEAAYAELVRQHRQRLLNLAARLTNSPHIAEDVVQETFLAAFRSMERFEPRPSVGAWLNAICVRLSSRAVSRSPGRRDDSLDRMLDADVAGDPGRPTAGVLADGTPGAPSPDGTRRRPRSAAQSPVRSASCRSSSGRQSSSGMSWASTTPTLPGRWTSP
jgi:RNA polymerase sigma factor (sigma-70 family)